MEDHPIHVTVVLPNWNGARWLPGCLKALARQTYRSFDVLLVDNASEDNSTETACSHYAGLQLIGLETNEGFSAACNRGWQGCRSPYVVFLNTDTLPAPDWLAALVAVMKAAPADVAGVSSMMVEWDDPGCIENAGVTVAWDGLDQKVGAGTSVDAFTQPTEIFAASAGAGLYRRTFLEATGGFNERYFMYLEDVELALRGRILGHRFILAPLAVVRHRGHGSGLASTRYVRGIVRNRLWMLAGCIPARLLLRYGLRLGYGQLYFILAQRRPGAAFRGCLDGLAGWGRARRECRALWQHARVTADELERMLQPHSSLLPMWKAVVRKWRRC